MAYHAYKLTNSVYHSIGGQFERREQAVEAVKAHFHGTHGGGGDFRHFHGGDADSGPLLIEVGHSNGDPLSAQAVYKVVAR